MKRSTRLMAVLLALAGLAPLAVQAQEAGLAAAVHSGSPRQVREAIARGGDPNGRLPDGETPLADAATSNNDPGVIAALVHAGAQVGAKDAAGMTPLMWAAAENPNPDVSAALLAAGADVNTRNVIGITPLMFAAKENSNPAVAQKLLSAGAGVNAHDLNGMTALMYAAKDNDSPTLIAELLGAGADARLASAGGKTALAYAQANPALKGTAAAAALEHGVPQTAVRTPAYMASLEQRYDLLGQRLYRDRYLTLPALERERVVKGQRGVVVEGLGVATAGMAGIFAYLSASDPGSPAIYHGAALASGAFSVVLLVWGTSLLLTRPSLSEIARLKAADRRLDAQLHKLALIRNSNSR